MKRMIIQSLIDKISKLFTSLWTDNSGNVEIGKKLHVDESATIEGPLEVNSYALDEDITISNLPTNLHCNYAHARVSNGKLNIVISLWKMNAISAVADDPKIATIPITSEIAEKLIPYNEARLTDSTLQMFGHNFNIHINKVTNELQVLLDNEASEESGFSSARYELNFIV